MRQIKLGGSENLVDKLGQTNEKRRIETKT